MTPAAAAASEPRQPELGQLAPDVDVDPARDDLLLDVDLEDAVHGGDPGDH